MNLRQELKQRRLMAGLSLEQAGDLLGYTAGTISKVENNKSGLQAEEYFRWVDVYQNVRHVRSFTFDRGDPAVSRR